MRLWNKNVKKNLKKKHVSKENDNSNLNIYWRQTSACKVFFVFWDRCFCGDPLSASSDNEGSFCEAVPPLQEVRKLLAWFFLDFLFSSSRALWMENGMSPTPPIEKLYLRLESCAWIFYDHRQNQAITVDHLPPLRNFPHKTKTLFVVKDFFEKYNPDRGDKPQLQHIGMAGVVK